MRTPTRMQQQIGCRIDRLHLKTPAQTSEATIARADTEPSAAAELTAGDSRRFAAALEAELREWDAYLERLQVRAATIAPRAREQAEAAISELRRHRNALAQRLSEIRSASGQAEDAARKSAEAALTELRGAAAHATRRCDRARRQRTTNTPSSTHRSQSR